jgi:hypothetical protein
MLIKDKEKSDELFGKIISHIPIVLKKYKYSSIVFLLVVYTFFVFYLGGTSYKMGYFGRIIKPMIETNIRIPFNYIQGILASTNHLYIDIRHKNFLKIAYKREQALKEGVLHTSSEDFVPAQIRVNDKTVKIDMRLKGDLEDHWAAETQWSFRIKTKDDDAILGMNEFSLQHPRTRGFLNDWFLHQFLKYIGGFIVLRYEFVELTVNGKYYGIYLMEEHFTSKLLENNKRINSPIIRIYDHLLWYNIDPLKGFSQEHLNEHFTLSPIDAFNTNDVLQDKLLFEYFKKSKDLLELFRRGELKTHEVFDLKKLADLFAIIDLFGYRHSTAYSNIRFYYNPVTSLLEPIGYDNTFIFEAVSIEGEHKKIRLLKGNDQDKIDENEYQIWFDRFFEDQLFFREYIKSLEKISQKKFLDEFFEAIKDDYKKALHKIYKTIPGYQFIFKKTFYDNQSYIRNILNPLQGIQAYIEGIDANKSKIKLQVANIQSLPIEVLDLTLDSLHLSDPLHKCILNSKQSHSFLNFNEIEYPIPPNVILSDSMLNGLQVNYKILGQSISKSVAVYPWVYKDEYFKEKDVFRKKTDINEFSFINVDDTAKKIVFAMGNWDIKKNIVLPAQYEVFVSSGTTLNLINSSKLITYSPLRIIGTPENPVIITSTDSSGQGLVMIGTKEPSIFDHVKFINLASPNDDGYILPGSINIYESTVHFDQCEFENNLSERFLNAIRSDINMTHSSFKNLSQNALNIIYSVATLSDISLQFGDSTAIVVVGSKVDANDLRVDAFGKRGFDFDIGSEIHANNIFIANTKIAIECKNDSKAYLHQLSVLNSSIGFLVYQTNQFDGSANIEIESLTSDNIDTLYKVDEKCRLLIDGKNKTGNFLTSLNMPN